MAGEKRNRAKLLAVTVLLCGAGIHAFAQQAHSGSLAGKLTDIHSVPLRGATIVLRNQATGVEARTTTSRDGSYRFTALPAGQYSIEAGNQQLGYGRLKGILVSAGHQARVQAAIQLDRTPSTPIHSVFLANPTPTSPPAPILTATLPRITQPPPALTARTAPNPVHEPTNTQIPVLAATLPPVPPQPILPVVVPTTAAPKLEAISAPSPTPAPQIQSPAALPANPPAPQQVASINADLQPPIPASAASALPLIAHALAISPSLAIGASVANGLRAAAQWTFPRPSPIQTAAELADPVSSAVTTTLSAAELQSLPASGRHWEDFLMDTPAASASAGSSQVSLRGIGQQQADTSIDGASTQLAFSGTFRSPNGSNEQAPTSQGVSEPQGMAQPWAGGSFSIGEAAVQTVEAVAGNASPEGGRAAGGRVNVETRRGSNNLHGQGFLVDRQNNWGARNPFTQWLQQTAPATSTAVPVFTAQPFTPPNHALTWGLGAGGQIRRNRLFWFASLDGLHRNDPGVSMVKHPYLSPSKCAAPPCSPIGFFAQPTNDQMQLLGAQLGTSTSSALASYSQMLQTLDSLLGPAPRTATQWSGFARIDWKAAERHSFFLEAIGANFNAPGGGLTRASETYGNHSLGSSQANKQWLLARWEAFLTSNLLATTQLSAGRTVHSAHAGTPSTFEQSLNQNVWGQLPQIVVDSRYGFTIGNPSRFGPGSYPDERLYRAQESVDWVHGPVLVKAGFELGHNADTTSLLRNQTGTYYYSSLANFVSDALVFGSYGFSDALDKFNPHNCDQTGKVWRDSTGTLRGLGNLPCYSYYSQTMGPSNWHLSTNDWAGYASAQWQPSRFAVFSAGLRWEHEQSPPPIASLANPALPLTGKLPDLGNNWGPRLSLALGRAQGHWPLLRLGYGMYYGRTSNAVLENVITHTGSLNGNLNFFMRPTDNLNAGGAPPFPYVFAGEPSSFVKPGAVEFAPNFRNAEIHQAVAAVEQSLPGHLLVSASAVLSLGRHLPVSIDSNFDPSANPGTITYAVVDGTGKGPIKATQITVPFYATWPSSITGTGIAGRLNPNYQQISEIFARANSTYEAAMLRVSRYGRRGLSLHASYTYAHAMDWNPNESSQVSGSDVLDPVDLSREYGVSNLDVRHSFSAMIILTSPWKLHDLAGKLANGWMISGTGHFRSGLPYTMRTSGSIPKEFLANGDAIVGLGPGMNGSGGDNRIYGFGNDNTVYNIGRNTYRYPAVWKADTRLSKQFSLGETRQLQLFAESFNLFNHQNVTQIETTGYYIDPGGVSGTLPTLNFLTGLKTNTSAFGQPLNINATNFYRERQIQLGLRMSF